MNHENVVGRCIRRFKAMVSFTFQVLLYRGTNVGVIIFESDDVDKYAVEIDGMDHFLLPAFHIDGQVMYAFDPVVL